MEAHVIRSLLYQKGWKAPSLLSSLPLSSSRQYPELNIEAKEFLNDACYRASSLSRKHEFLHQLKISKWLVEEILLETKYSRISIQ